MSARFQNLSIKQLRGMWLQQYARVSGLNKKLKVAKQAAANSPYQTDQLRVADLEREVKLATQRAIEIRDAMDEAKYAS